MNSAPASTPSIAWRIRGRSGSYCAFTSTSGIGGTVGKSRGTYLSVDPKGQEHQDYGDKGVLDVAEVVVEALVAPAGRPADARERERPDGRADRRQDRVAPEGHLEDPCRDRDERADHRRDPSDQDREVVPAVEPALGPLELVVAEVEPPSAVLEEGPPPVDPDRPTGDSAGQVTERSGQCDHDVGPEVRFDPVPEEDDVLARKGARCKRPAVHHDQLARGRKDRVDRHQEKDR